MNTREFLDAVKQQHGLATDYKLAQFLGWNPRRISMYRTTPRELDDAGCLQIADALNVPAAYVMACIAAARAKTAEAKAEWLRAANLLKKGLAASLVLAVLGALQNPTPASAAPSVFQFSELYIMRTRRRWGWRAANCTMRILSKRRRRRIVRNAINKTRGQP